MIAAEPYTDIGTHLRDELRRVWLRIAYQIQLGGRNDQAPSWTQLPDEQTRRDDMALFAATRGGAAADAGAEQLLNDWLSTHAHVEARIRASLDAKERSPLVDVFRAFDLTQRQWATLMFALLPEIEPNLVSAYAYIARDPACRGLDGRLLAQFVYDRPETRALMARDLAPSSPLLRYRLLEIGPSTSRRDSLLFRPIGPAPRLVYVMDDAPLALDPELATIADLRPARTGGSFPRAVVERATSAMRSNEVVLVVQGQRGLGKKLLVQSAAAHWNRRAAVIDAGALARLSAAAQLAAVSALVRELLLLDALPVFGSIDDTVTDAERDMLPACFGLFLNQWNGPVAITIDRERLPRMPHRPIVHVTLEVPPLPIRTEMWQHAEPALAAPDAERLAGRFAIPGGIIFAAAQAARGGRLPDAGPPMPEDLDRAVAAQLHQRITRLGKKLPTPFTLDDLIVDDDTRTALVEISAAARERHKIRDRFALRGAQGVTVLFSGHPGVGKTMSATVLAKQLGLEVYEIDVSQIVSKWLGETEKNLSDVFDAAEPGHVVLLFNEADSLFGKRTSEVSSSNDRYSNMETNYLLQRLERFNGLAILTTNLTGAIDPAFKRRFTYDVYFSFPSVEMRAELWRRTLPEAARAGINFHVLAEEFELTGGFIKVACERAAYIAGASGCEIDEDLLRATVARMYRERGKLSSAGPLD